jgi:hypothetical protein
MEKCIIHVNYSNETILMVILNFDGHHHDFFPARVLGGVTRKIRLNDFALFAGNHHWSNFLDFTEIPVLLGPHLGKFQPRFRSPACVIPFIGGFFSGIKCI